MPNCSARRTDHSKLRRYRNTRRFLSHSPGACRFDNSAVRGRIEYFPLCQDLLEEEVVPCEALPDLFGSAYEQIDGKRWPETAENLSGLARSFPFMRQDDQQVDIGVLGRRAVGIRAE